MRPSLLIVSFEPWHLAVMKSRPEQQKEQEFIEQTFGLEAYGDVLLGTSPTNGTALIGGKVVACWGVSATSHIGDAWAFISEDFINISPRHQLEVAKAMRNCIIECGLQRVQATCEEGFSPFESFLRKVGMQFEGVLRNYGVDKVNHKMYSYIGE